MYILCPHCGTTIERTGPASPAPIICSSCGSTIQLEAGATGAWSPKDSQRKVGKFELIDTVGVGAFGTVYKARDPELDRIVALKVPRAASVVSSGDLDRFLREARSAAQLRHPSIVPVYDVGEWRADDVSPPVPYLVSEFVQGVTLSDLLSARRPSPRESAEMLAAVADALQYAHDMGVVHRDVKPSNIMLEAVSSQLSVVSGNKPQAATQLTTDHGQLTPRLMDFGLAKRDAGEITMTMDGQVLGTPAYMSPEQARGEAHKVDGRTDIYSVGVILYEMLTGELPFRGTTRMLLHQVLHDEPRPPRRLNDQIPRDLETICLKAMAKEPRRRYETARAFADDLRRWLRNEPILARPVGRVEKAWRWSQRNRLAASLTAALLVMLVGGLAAVTTLWLVAEHRRLEAEQRRFEADYERGLAKASADDARQQKIKADANAEEVGRQKNEVERHRAEAVKNFHRARDAVKSYLTNVGRNPRLREAGLHGLRKELLHEARVFYQQFIDEYMPHPDLDADLAWAHFDLAFIHSETGAPTEAIQHYQKAAELFDRLGKWTESYRIKKEVKQELGGPLININIGVKVRREITRDAEFHSALAKTYNNLGSLHYNAREYDKAEAAFLKALPIHQSLTNEYPDNAEFFVALAHHYGNLGNVAMATGQPAKAEPNFKRALEIREELVRKYPKEPAYHGHLAGSVGQMAELLAAKGDTVEAEKSCQRAVDLARALAEAHPRVAEYRWELAQALGRLGNQRKQTGKPEQAVAAYEEAARVLAALTAMQPGFGIYQERLAQSWERLGQLHAAGQHWDKAESAYKEALAARTRLTQEYPGVLQYERGVADCHNEMGIQFWLGDQLDKAEAAYRETLAIRERLAKDNPKNPEVAVELGGVLCNIGHLLTKKKQPNEALALYNRSVEVLSKFTTHAASRAFLKNAFGGRAETFVMLQRYDEAVRDLQRRLDLDESQPLPPAVSLAGAQNYLADQLRTSGKPKEAMDWYDKAINALEPLVRQSSALPKTKHYLGAAYAGRAKARFLVTQRTANVDSVQQTIRDLQQASEFVEGNEAVSVKAFLGMFYVMLGQEYRKQNQSQEALEAFSKSVEVLSPLLPAAPKKENVKFWLFHAHFGRATMLQQLDRIAEAAEDLDRALLLAPDDSKNQVKILRALVRACRGDHAGAAADVESLAGDASTPRDQLSGIAGVYARASESAGKDESLSPAERSKQATVHADKAVELLKKLHSDGYFRDAKKIDFLKTDRDLKPVRQHEGFQKLLKQVEEAGPPTTKATP